MAIQPPTKEERDANLDALQSAVDEWAEAEKTRIENGVQFLRAVKQGRGASGNGTSNLASISAVLVAEIDDFLIGS